MCGSMFDRLSKLMLHDLCLGIDYGMMMASCNSVASSLWAVMLGSVSKGIIGECLVCGLPFIAPPKRRKDRIYCSDKCNKKH